MSTAARIAPIPEFEAASAAPKTSSRTPKPRSSAVTACPGVLLVGRQGAWSDALLESLQKVDGQLSYVTPLSATQELVRKGEYSLVLLDSTVPPEQRRDLVSALTGTKASVFYTFPVENGCWWLPALQFGTDCHGSPAFRRREFHAEVEHILRDHEEP